MWQPTFPGMESMSPVPQGKLGDIYNALPPDERLPYMRALNDKTVPAEKLVTILARMGHTVSASLIRTHRRGLQEDL